MSRSLASILVSVLFHFFTMWLTNSPDFGQSYASDSLSAGSSYFAGEINCVQTAAKIARNLGAKGKWTLSVGATPTAHAAVQEAVKEHGPLEGELEL